MLTVYAPKRTCIAQSANAEQQMQIVFSVFVTNRNDIAYIWVV
jgi:hypothetical protein